MGGISYSTTSTPEKERFVKNAGRDELLEIARDLMDCICWIHYEIKRVESQHTFIEARAYVFADWMHRNDRRGVSTESMDRIKDALKYCFPDLEEKDIRALIKWERKRRVAYAKERNAPKENVILLVSHHLTNSSPRSRSRRSPVRSASKSGDDGGGEDSDGSDPEPPRPLIYTHRLILLRGGEIR